MSDTINVIANITQIIGFPATVWALLYARIQLKKAATTARVQILLALDERLSEFEDIRVELNTGQLNIEKDEKKIRLRRYIGTFERVGHALRLKEITLETVDQFYGDRFKNLIKYLIAHSAARRIVKNRNGWEDFYHLWEELLGYEA